MLRKLMNAYGKCVLSDRIDKAEVDYEAQPNDGTNIYFVFWFKQCKSESFNFTEI